MAATKVSVLGNFLKIEITGGETTYGNTAWYELISVSNSEIKLLYQAGAGLKYYNIAVADFQDGAGVPVGTSEQIITYLSDKIG